jgi:hypothetical protein
MEILLMKTTTCSLLRFNLATQKLQCPQAEMMQQGNARMFFYHRTEAHPKIVISLDCVSF